MWNTKRRIKRANLAKLRIYLWKTTHSLHARFKLLNKVKEMEKNSKNEGKQKRTTRLNYLHWFDLLWTLELVLLCVVFLSEALNIEYVILHVKLCLLSGVGYRSLVNASNNKPLTFEVKKHYINIEANTGLLVKIRCSRCWDRQDAVWKNCCHNFRPTFVWCWVKQTTACKYASLLLAAARHCYNKTKQKPLWSINIFEQWKLFA